MNESLPKPPTTAPLAALVLAGRRGPTDTVAASAGSSHKALVRVGGVPMLLRVVQSLRAVPAIGRVLVSIDAPEALSAVAELRDLVAGGVVEIHPSLPSPSASVLDCFERLGGAGPLLVTTADHPLLTAEMIDAFRTEALASDADLVVGVVPASVVRQRFPGSRRTFLRFRDASVTGANLFLLRTPRAARAARFWSRAERFRKRPWRLVAVFGPWALARFALRRLDVETALAEFSAAMGARVRALALPFAECAIDVDGPADLELAARILASRRPGA